MASILLVSRDLAFVEGLSQTLSAALRLPLARGAALVTYQTAKDAPPTFPFRFRRPALADLQLPLERKRLLALVKSVENRAHASGRDTADEIDSVEGAARG